ncbi:MAG: hypothetical protein NDI80_07765 [Flavobacteriaceae bacterium]|nr:hypothetical protein [Flavobacteriaceae bacterium]
MKTLQKIKSFAIIILILAFVGSSYKVNAQDEKQSLSITLTYHKITGGDSFLKISTSFKGENGWQDAAKVPFEIINTDNESSLGKGITDMHGKAKFIFPKGFLTAENNIELRISEHPIYEDTEESLYFRDVNLIAELIVNKDSTQIKATLLDVDGNPIVDEGLKVQVKRLFKGLNVGDDAYYTDENGMIVADIVEEYKSFDGNLIFEVTLEEHDEFGTVKCQMPVDFGISGTDLSTFDERTMWSPANKTPLFMLVFPNLVLLGIIGVFVYLIMNLIKISKSKN